MSLRTFIKILFLLIIVFIIWQLVSFISRDNQQKNLINFAKSEKIVSFSHLDDGYLPALRIAKKWRDDAYFVEISTWYSLHQDKAKLISGRYTFIGGDVKNNKEDYVSIKIYSDKHIDTYGPYANEGQASHVVSPFIIEKNKIRDTEIIQMAWDKVGSKLECKAGLEYMTLANFGGELQNTWIVTYKGSDFHAATLFINETTGVRNDIDINEYFCKLKES